jgi:hypothetical protein
VSAPEPPEGLVYAPGFLSEKEEAELVAELERLEFQEVRMRRQAARRTVRHFGTLVSRYPPRAGIGLDGVRLEGLRREADEGLDHIRVELRARRFL